jgi:ribosomal protein L37AE/L43A
MKRVFEDNIEISLCPKCECENVKYKNEHWVCENCDEMIL